MKKVLIITYYWPPSGGAGVQRWLKFVKYLREYGWEPVIYTPENPEAPALDPSLEKDIPKNVTIIKRPIWEPYTIYKRFIGHKKEDRINAGFLTEKKKPGLAEKISVWIRGNWFIPDARKFWIKPSVRFLSEYLKENPVEAIVSTGPPHSMHLIALGLKKKLNLPWLADFRDPWTTIDFYKDLKLSRSSDAKHHRLEKEVLETADVLVAVSWHMAEGFGEILGNKGNKVMVITNGYDETDFPNTGIKTSSKFTISHVGAMNADRNPKILWAALKELLVEIPGLKSDLEIRLIGKSDLSVNEELEKNSLHSFVKRTEYLPHDQTASAMQEAQVLLLALNDTPNTKGVVSGKLFEYLAAKRPILCIGKEDGDAAKIINGSTAGTVCDFKDKEKMKAVVKEWYSGYLNDNLVVQTDTINTYSRKELTGRIAGLLQSMIKGRGKA